jgi:hypothetical protein
MQLTFDAQNAARNQPFIITHQFGIDHRRDKSGHIVVAGLTSLFAFELYGGFGNIGGRMRLRRLRHAIATPRSILFVIAPIPATHETNQANCLHAPQTKKASPHGKTATATA